MAVCALGSSVTFWGASTEVEVYTLNVFLISLVILFALIWSKTSDDRWVYAGGLIYGLASGNHAAVAFYALPFFIFIFLKKNQNRYRRIIFLLFTFLLGFSVYLYLPVRSVAEPSFNLGGPETWERFFSHVTDRKDAGIRIPVSGSSGTILKSIWHFISETVPLSFWSVGFPLLILGAWKSFIRDRLLTLTLLLVAFINLFLFYRWTKTAVFMPAYFINFIFIGVGFFEIFRRLLASGFISSSAFYKGFSVIILLVLVGVMGLKFNTMDRSHEYLSNEAFRVDIENMDPDAVVLTQTLWFHHRAHHDIYRLREDVTTLLINDFVRPDLFDPVTQVKFPRITVPDGDPFYRVDDYVFLRKFLKANLREGRSIYWESRDFGSGIFYPNLVPALDFLWKFNTEPVKKIPKYSESAALERIQKKLEREVADGLIRIRDPHDYYSNILIQTSNLFGRHGNYSAALKLYKLVIDLFGPTGSDTLQDKDVAGLMRTMAINKLRAGNIEEAEILFKKAISIYPFDFDTWSNLGHLYKDKGKIDEALDAYKEASDIAPDHPMFLYEIGKCYELKNDFQKAEEYFMLAWKKTSFEDEKKEIMDRIKLVRRKMVD